MTALIDLFARSTATRPRVLTTALGSVLFVLLGVALAAGDGTARDALVLVRDGGLGLFVPVVAAVFATSVLGDPADDGSLGYLLLTPRSRWQVAVPAVATVLVVVVPLVTFPLVAAVAVNGADGRAVAGVGVAAAAGAAAYGAVFVAIGLRLRRALLVALLYVAIWEGVVAPLAAALGRASIRQYAESLQAGVAGTRTPAGGVGGPTAAVALATIVVAATALATWWLRTHVSRT